MLNNEILQLKSYDDKTGREISNVFPITNLEAVKVDSDTNLKEKLTEIGKQIEQTNNSLGKIDKKMDSHIENHPQNSIDDTTISKEKTWSSTKIESFVHTNDGVILCSVQGENLSLDYTKEGYLKEIEIFGNTIQNKDDVSDIQHLGELYVDDAGLPILDSKNKEQYKIDVTVNNGVLWEGNFEFRVSPHWDTAELTDGGSYGASDYIEIKGGALLNQKISYSCFFFDKDKKPITHKRGINITAPENAKYARVTEYCKFGQQDTFLRIQGVSDTNKKEYKTTLLLPCQLRKVGNVVDRLCWNSSKGKYVIEQNTLKFLATYVTRGVSEDDSYVWLYRLNDVGARDSKIIVDSSVYIGHRDSDWVNLKVNKDFYHTNGYTLTDHNRFLRDYPVNVICATSNTNKLVETNITEQILLPCYKDKTYLFVTGGIDGSIKTKAPVNGGKAIQSLSTKYETLIMENEEIKAINKVQDELIHTTMLATEQMYCLLEPLLIDMFIDDTTINPLLNMYVVMVQRGIKTIEQVPVKYREQVQTILEK